MEVKTRIVYCKCGAPNRVTIRSLHKERGSMEECPECWGGGILRKLNDLLKKVKKSALEKWKKNIVVIVRIEINILGIILVIFVLRLEILIYVELGNHFGKKERNN